MTLILQANKEWIYFLTKKEKIKKNGLNLLTGVGLYLIESSMIVSTFSAFLLLRQEFSRNKNTDKVFFSW